MTKIDKIKRLPIIEKIDRRLKPNDKEATYCYVFKLETGEKLESVEEFISYIYSITKYQISAKTIYKRLNEYIKDYGDMNDISYGELFKIKAVKVKENQYYYIKISDLLERFSITKTVDAINSRKQYLKNKYKLTEKKALEKTLSELIENCYT